MHDRTLQGLLFRYTDLGYETLLCLSHLPYFSPTELVASQRGINNFADRWRGCLLAQGSYFDVSAVAITSHSKDSGKMYVRVKSLRLQTEVVRRRSKASNVMEMIFKLYLGYLPC